jgi:endo-1,4-beta-xylanase
MTDRRSFLTGCAGLALTAASPTARAEGAGLGALAARSGRFFGSAVTARMVVDGGAYGRLLDEECTVWVPEWELKWGALVRDPGAPPDFAPVDAIVAAAGRHGKRLRGHTLLWHEHLPAAIAGSRARTDWDRLVVPHLTGVATRYRDAIFQWDVVNEAIEPRDGGADLMRRSPFYRMIGPDYAAEAFRIAHAAAPTGRLYLVDHGLCYAESWQAARRSGVLRLLERLLAAGVPVHGFGIQGHLDTRFTFDEAVFRSFVAALADLGLEIAVTELDVREADAAGSRSIVARRQRAADEVRKVLSVVLDCPASTGVVTWGLADGESWLRKGRPIPDNQGLPYDDTLAPTAMRTTLATLFAAARKKHD